MPVDETRLILLSGVVGAIFAAWRFGAIDGFGCATVLAGVSGFDVVGGTVCNATQATKRWYHRSEKGWRAKVGFVLPHLGYVAVIAWLWRGNVGFDWPYFTICSAAILGELRPCYLRRLV